MDTASLLVGILIGFAVAALIAFPVGMLIGSMSGRVDAVKSVWDDLFASAAKRLELRECYHVEFMVSKLPADDEGGGNGESEKVPDPFPSRSGVFSNN